MKRAIVAAALGLLAAAQPASAAQGPPPFAAVTGAFFAVSVKDIGASARWYGEHFGMTVSSRSTFDDASSVVLTGNGLEIELLAFSNSVERTDLGDAKARPRGLVKVGFQVPNFDETVAMLRSRHVDIVVGPFPARRTQRANVIVRDNEGNLIQLFGGFARE
jgi:catechol 2,3-dioxygenase-like lactoylglutathione lyase family enzyme